MNSNALYYLTESEYIDIFGTPECLWKAISETNRDSEFFLSKDPLSPVTKKPYYASCMALCQRPGSGKTRTMFEIGERYCPMFYICMSGPYKSPKRITDVLLNKYTFEKEGAMVSTKGLVAACGQFLLHKLEKAKILSSSDPGYPQFCRDFVKVFKPSHPEEATEKIWSDIIHRMKIAGPDSEKIMEELTSKGISHFIVAVDEARALFQKQEKFSCFNVLRRAFVYGENATLVPFLLLADSDPKIADPGASLRVDPSWRSVNLFPPFVLLDNADLFAAKYIKRFLSYVDAGDKADWAKFLAERDKSGSFAKLGSPLWKTRWEGPVSLSLVQYARNQLAKPKEGQSRARLKHHHFLSAIMCRVNVRPDPNFTLGNELAKNHAANIDHMYSQWAKVFVSYPSDPILAEGAAEILSNNGVRAMRALLLKIYHLKIKVGDGSRVVFELAACAAADKCAKRLEPCVSVSSEAFVSSLFSAAVFEKNGELKPTLHEVLAGTKLFFNHFMALEDETVPGDVHMAFFRGAALSCAEHQQTGYDHIIPYVTPNERMGCIFFQVRNCKDDLWRPEIIEVFTEMKAYASEIVSPETCKNVVEDYRNGKLDPESLPNFENCVFILLNLMEGCKSKFSVEVTGEQKRQGIDIAIQGAPTAVFGPLWEPWCERTGSVGPKTLRFLDAIVRPRHSFYPLLKLSTPKHFQEMRAKAMPTNMTFENVKKQMKARMGQQKQAKQANEANGSN